jgi:hypothetical protein
MRRMLALLILGASIAIPGAAAFAEAGDDHHPGRPNTATPPVMLQMEPTNQSAVAGSDAQLPVYIPMRFENFGR